MSIPGLPNRPVPVAERVDAETWLLHLFSSKAAREGGVIRRSLRDVERIVGLNRAREELERRGFSAVTDDRQLVIFCHSQRVRRFA